MSDTTRAMIDLPCSYCGNHHSYSPEMCRDMYIRPVTVTSTCDFCPRLKKAEAREAALVNLLRVAMPNRATIPMEDVPKWWAEANAALAMKEKP